MLRVFWVVVLVLVLAACGSSPTSTPSAIPEIHSPTEFLLPSDTPAPTATSLPERLETMPETYNQADMVVIADAFAFQVIHTYTLSQLNDWTPPEGKTYFVMEGIVFNYSDSAQELFRTHFEIETVTGEKILPNLDLMAALQTSEYADLDYAGRRNFPSKALPIDAHSWRNTFLAYEISNPVEMLRLHFTPLDRPTPSTIEIWFLEGEGAGELRAYEAYDNGVQQFEIEFDYANHQTVIEDVIDEQEITVDNCFGTDVIDRTRTFSETTETSYSFGTDAGLGAGLATGTGFLGLLGNGIVGDFLTLNFSVNYEVSDGESITETIEETLRAAPGTVTNYQLTWYRVTLQGMMRVRLGGDNFFIPYSLTNRLRADLTSLPAGTCPEATQDN